MSQSPIDDVFTTVEVLYASRNEDDEFVISEFVERGKTELQAEILIAFVPLAFGRRFLGDIPANPPVRWSANCCALDQYNRKFEIRLADVPVYVEAFRLAEETYRTGIITREHFEATVWRSAEVKVANQALNDGSKLGDLVFSEPIFLCLAEAPGFEQWYRSLHKG